MALTQTVRVWTRTATGTDPMGEPAYAWAHEDVGGVLVRTGTSGGVDDDGLRPDGVRVSFALSFPKGYDVTALSGCRVTLLDQRYGMDQSETDGWATALIVSGQPYPQVPCPTSWDNLVEVGRVDG